MSVLTIQYQQFILVLIVLKYFQCFSSLKICKRWNYPFSVLKTVDLINYNWPKTSKETPNPINLIWFLLNFYFYLLSLVYFKFIFFSVSSLSNIFGKCTNCGKNYTAKNIPWNDHGTSVCFKINYSPTIPTSRQPVG